MIKTIKQNSTVRWWRLISVTSCWPCTITSNTPLFSDITTDNILAVTNREFRLRSIMGTRSIQSRSAYVELLDCVVRAVVGRKVYIDSRMTKPLSEWFTLTDKAVLFLCLESYVPKWNREWAQSSRAPVAAAAAAARQQKGEQKVGDEDALYTGKSRGTKRSWSKDGLERFNGLMIDVYRDRQANGANFDNIIREEMIKRNGKQNDTTKPVRGEDEQTNPEKCVVVVNSDF